MPETMSLSQVIIETASVIGAESHTIHMREGMVYLKFYIGDLVVPLEFKLKDINGAPAKDVIAKLTEHALATFEAVQKAYFGE